MEFLIKTAEMGTDKEGGEIVGVQLVGALSKEEYEKLLSASSSWVIKLSIDSGRK